MDRHEISSLEKNIFAEMGKEQRRMRGQKRSVGKSLCDCNTGSLANGGDKLTRSPFKGGNYDRQMTIG